MLWSFGKGKNQKDFWRCRGNKLQLIAWWGWFWICSAAVKSMSSPFPLPLYAMVIEEEMSLVDFNKFHYPFSIFDFISLGEFMLRRGRRVNAELTQLCALMVKTLLNGQLRPFFAWEFQIRSAGLRFTGLC